MFAEVGEVSAHRRGRHARQQVAERDARLQAAPPTVCAASSASAARRSPSSAGTAWPNCFDELGVHTFDGGPTMNPSTYELHAAIHEVAAEEVLVLANSPNVDHGRRARRGDVRQAGAGRTERQPAGGARDAVALDPDRGGRRTRARCGGACAALRTGAVAQAARDDGAGRFRPRGGSRLRRRAIVCWGDPAETLRAVLAELEPGAELISVLEGERPATRLASVTALANGNGRLELELRHGGQPAYWWLLSAE